MARALSAAAKDISRLGVELEQQQAEVKQKLVASQALAETLQQQAAAANLSVEQVKGYFFQVFDVAMFVANERDR